MKRRYGKGVLVFVSLLVGIGTAVGGLSMADGLSVLFVLSDPYAANVGVWSHEFDRLGYDLTFAGASEEIPAYDPAGAAIRVDATLARAFDVSAFDAIVLATQPVDAGSIAYVGQDLRSSPAAVGLVRDANGQGLAMYVGASAFGLLLDAGLVEGRSVLCHAGLLASCHAAGGLCSPSRSIDPPLRDGNLVTGTSWFAFPIEIAEEVGRALDEAWPMRSVSGDLAVEDLLFSRADVFAEAPMVAGFALGGARADGAVSVCRVPGGFVAAGYTFSSSGGSADLLVMGFDDRGRLLWARAIGGPGRDYAQAVCATDDGGCLVAGFTTSVGAGQEDALLVRCASDGTVTWAKTFGGEGPDMALGVCATQDGGFAFCGYTMSEGSGGSDLWVVRVDADGREVWSAVEGGARNERGYAIRAEPDGRLCVAGATTTTGGSYDGQVTWLGADGSVVASTQTGWSSANVFEDFTVPADGGVVAVGYGDSQRGEAEGVVAASFDPTGKRRWAKRIEDAATFDRGAGILSLESGDLFVCGVSSSTDPTERDVLLMKLDSFGRPLWTGSWGADGRCERAEAMCRLESGKIVVVGHTTDVAAASQDVLVLVVDPDELP